MCFEFVQNFYSYHWIWGQLSTVVIQSLLAFFCYENDCISHSLQWLHLVYQFSDCRLKEGAMSHLRKNQTFFFFICFLKFLYSIIVVWLIQISGRIWKMEKTTAWTLIIQFIYSVEKKRDLSNNFSTMKCIAYSPVFVLPVDSSGLGSRCST